LYPPVFSSKAWVQLPPHSIRFALGEDAKDKATVFTRWLLSCRSTSRTGSWLLIGGKD